MHRPSCSGRMSALPEADESLLRELVLEYFVVSGNSRAAKCFALESGTSMGPMVETIDARARVNDLVAAGRIADAVLALKEIDSSILGRNQKLHFALCIQQFVEILRQGRSKDALLFARGEMAVLGALNPEHAAELQRCLTLLLFSSSNTYPDNLMEYFNLKRRESLVTEVNNLLLKSYSHGTEPKLHQIIRALHRKQKDVGTKLPGFAAVEGLIDQS